MMPKTSVDMTASMKKTPMDSGTATQPLANGSARKAVKAPQKAMYGPRRKSIWSASAGMRSSLTSSFTPSAMVWSQPNLPPTRVGPRRSWMRPATLRSSQMKKMAEAATKVSSRTTDRRAAIQLARSGETPRSFDRSITSRRLRPGEDRMVSRG